jgi:putative MATE family efflux protein
MTAEPQSVSVAPGPASFWRTVREALAGAEGRDFTQGPINQALLLLAIPMVLEVALESVFAVVNIFWVNQLTPAAVATVGVTEAMFSFIYALGMGLGIGATAMVSRRIGEKRPDKAADVAVQAIFLGVLVAVPIGLLGGLFAPQLLRAMDAPADVVASGSTFTRIMFGGNVVVLLLFLINAIFRGAGDAAVAMRCLWIANLANLILDPLLIFGIGPFPELGVTGAAVATTVGRGLGVVYQFYRLAGRDRRFVIERRQVRPDPALMGRLMRLSGSAIFQVAIGTVSWTVLVRVVAHFGEAAIAGYTSAVRVIMFAILPAWGLSNAAATMVGQALGAKLPDRAERAVWRAGFLNLLFLGALGVLFVILAPQVLFFVKDPEVKRYAVDALRIVALGYPFYAYGMVLSNSFNGAGDTTTPTVLNLCCFWALEIPLAWVLARTIGLGPRGVFIAIMVAFSTLAISSAVLFRRGRWKAQAV